MLGTVLGNLQGEVAGIDHILADAGDFVAEDEGVLAAGLAAEGADRMQRGDGVQGVVIMLPRD